MLKNLSYYFACIGIGGALLINNPHRNFQRDIRFMKIQEREKKSRRYLANDDVGIFIAPEFM